MTEIANLVISILGYLFWVAGMMLDARSARKERGIAEKVLKYVAGTAACYMMITCIEGVLG
jgi:hypothetical protein